jgi:hypothetical protein
MMVRVGIGEYGWQVSGFIITSDSTPSQIIMCHHKATTVAKQQKLKRTYRKNSKTCSPNCLTYILTLLTLLK